MGEVWREELEIPNLEVYIHQLYKEIEPFYVALHAVVRHKLFLKYGSKIIDKTGPIPIHLLGIYSVYLPAKILKLFFNSGNMWGQDWSSLIDLFVPEDQLIGLDKRLKATHSNERSLVSFKIIYAKFSDFPLNTIHTDRYSSRKTFTLL